MARKAYVEVTVVFDREGNMRPVSILWEDGRVYPIDKIADKRQAASLKAGGTGIRYVCFIGGKQTYLFYEDPKWFVEAKE